MPTLPVNLARAASFPLIVQSGGAGIDELIAIAGPLANNMLKYDVIDESLPRVQPFVALYKQKYTGVMNGLARTWRDPKKFLHDLHKGLWAHHNKLDANVV